jgi:hypothetical protein
MAKAERRAIDKTLIFLGLVTAVFMLIFGGLAWYGYHFATTTVQKYAGQLVDNGPKAKAYANEFIGKHLQAVADGQTYSEVSSQSLKDPSNQKLQAQKAVLFQGETLRGLLLGDGYAYWTFGMLSKYVAITAFAGAGVMAILVWLGAMHLSRLR